MSIAEVLQAMSEDEKVLIVIVQQLRDDWQVAIIFRENVAKTFLMSRAMALGVDKRCNGSIKSIEMSMENASKHRICHPLDRSKIEKWSSGILRRQYRRNHHGNSMPVGAAVFDLANPDQIRIYRTARGVSRNVHLWYCKYALDSLKNLRLERNITWMQEKR